MEKFDLIEIDEALLPDVSLDDSQINKIKKSLKFTLNWCLDKNSNLNLDTSIDNILEIYNSLGPERDETIHLSAHAKVLQKLVLDAFNKKYMPSKDTLLCSKFLNTGAGYEFKDMTPTWPNFAFYYQLYLTDEYLYVYSFTNMFKIIKARKLPYNNIKFAYLSNSYNNNLNYSNVNLIIELKNDYENSSFNFVAEEPKNIDDLKEILTILHEKNVPKTLPPRTPISVLKIIIFLIIVFICSIFLCSIL